MDKSRYTGKIRVRSCGILIEDKKILLLQILSPVIDEWIWIPPGGKVEFGESLQNTVKREFREETGLEIAVQHLLHVHEVIQNDIHAIEFYYSVKRTGGKLKRGKDPELPDKDQIIQDIQYFSREELGQIKAIPDFINNELWQNDNT